MRRSMIGRRTFLKVTGVAGGTAMLCPAQVLAQGLEEGDAQQPVLLLEAREVDVPLLGADEPLTPAWAYNGMVPGPEIRVKAGEMVQARLFNRLPVPTSIHWHGMRIENEMDGAAGLTQEPVGAGESFDYAFVAPDPGTYWYHAHMRSELQVARGLYGPLIVEGDDPGEMRDVTLMLDDWRLNEEGRIDEASFGSLQDAGHAGRLGNWVTVNGVSAPVFEAAPGERLRLRLISAANARIFHLALAGSDADATPVPAEVIALDGAAVEDPVPLEAPLTLAPAQRVDLMLLAPREGSVALRATDGGTEVTIASIDIVGEAVAAPAAVPLEPPVMAEPDLRSAKLVDLIMDGGAMGRMRGAKVGADVLDMRDLVEQGLVWAMNGRSDMPEEPLFEVEAGETVILNLINRTRWPHAVHLHGHHFKVLGGSDPLSEGAWRDTVLVEPERTANIVLVADKEGRWLLHCHMLEHQAAGMATWFKVG